MYSLSCWVSPQTSVCTQSYFDYSGATFFGIFSRYFIFSPCKLDNIRNLVCNWEYNM